MKALALLLCAGLSCMAAASQTFSRWFTDATLRVDYIFAGDSASQQIYLDALSRTDGWAGRRHALDSLCLQGNGRITMRDAATDSVIYRTSFSSLFQEWQATQEAARVRKSFENCFLLPLPKQPANVTVELSNSRRQTTARLTHRVDPQDILIRHIGQRPAPSRYLLRSGSPEECIDIVMVPEGYTEAEMDVFYRDATAATEALFAHEPFKTYRSRFDVVAAHLPSKESGVSVPLKGEWKETTLGSHFSTFYSDRYLTTLQLKRCTTCWPAFPTNTSSFWPTPTPTAAAAFTTPTCSPPRTTRIFCPWWYMSSATVLRAWPTNIFMTTSTWSFTPTTWSRGSATSPRWLTLQTNGRTWCRRAPPCPRRPTARMYMKRSACMKAPATSQKAFTAAARNAA